MSTIQFESQVGSDGVLLLRVPLGETEANKRVVVTVEPLPSPPSASEEIARKTWDDIFAEKLPMGSRITALDLSEVSGDDYFL